jgi:GxxExxY protein
MNNHPTTNGSEASVLNALSERVVGSAIEVHRHLGPGLLESAYEECLCYELSHTGLRFERQTPLPVKYKGVLLDAGYRIDVLVEQRVLVELKCVERLAAIHEAQVLTYLKLMDARLGLLINFNVPALKQGIKRIVNRFPS